MKEHDERLNRVFEVICENNQKLKVVKCEFRKSEIKYVAHILTLSGVNFDTEYIRAQSEMPKPRNIKTLQSFLDLSII